MKKIPGSTANVKEDFGYQYIQVNDELIQRYIDSIKRVNPDYLLFYGYSIERILEKRFFANLIYNQQLRDIFNGYSINGFIAENLKEIFYQKAYGEFFFNPEDAISRSDIKDSDCSTKARLKEALCPYKGKMVYYAYNVRFVEIALPILSNLGQEVIVLSYEDIPESLTYPDNILIVEFPVVKIRDYANDFMESKFPILYYLFNSLEFLLGILEPKSILIIEGANVVEYNMLAVIGKKHNIPTICIQHGWPGLLYSGFKEMHFDYFLSWGNRFTKLLKPFNPQPKFIPTGYPYVVSCPKEKNKKAIAFFFQGPYFVSTLSIIEQMLDFAIFCASSFPSLTILIREHPSHKLNPVGLKKMASFSNIQFVPSEKEPLKNVFSKSLISVSVFSSTLVESLAYCSVPFIFNLTSMPHYLPDLQKEGLGIEVKTMKEAKERMTTLIANQSLINQYKAKILKRSADFFSSTGNKAIKNIVAEIKSLN